MKNFLALMIYVLPLTLFSQTRPMPKKPNFNETPKNEIMPEQKPTSFVYLIMTVEEVKKTKKDDSDIKFKFNSFDDRLSEKMDDIFKTEKSVINVLNKLGQRGWELVSINNEYYFFKNRFFNIYRY